MAATITITEEAQAFFDRNTDPALRAMVDEGVREYSAFMGGSPIAVDAFDEEDADATRVALVVEVAPDEAGAARNRRNEFARAWFGRHGAALRRRMSFSVRYR